MKTKPLSFTERAEALSNQIVSWRRYLHENPELSFQEVNTKRFILSELEKIENVQVEKITEKGGIIASISSGAGPTVAIRADIDALPITEENNHSFISKNQGVMHACGHDAHTAMLLGAVKLLSEDLAEKKFSGTIKFLFQQAEEATDEHGLTGAPYMLETGGLDDVEAVIALHVCPWQPVGTVQMNHGYSMANVDVFEAKIKGTGGHGGYPHMATDPVYMLGNVLQAFYGVPSRRISSLDTVAASIGKIDAGAVSNVIPSEVVVEGTLRSYTPEAREKLASEIERVFQIVEPMGGTYEFTLEKGEPALNNNKEVNGVIENTIQHLYPEMNIHWEPFGMGGEDFGFMTQKIPGAMFFLGCSLEDGLDRDLHTPIFDINEACLPKGTAILAESAKQLLQYRSMV